MKSAEGVVTRNPSYQGAPEADVTHVSNWFHFRAKQVKAPSINQLAHIDPAIGAFCLNSLAFLSKQQN